MVRHPDEKASNRQMFKLLRKLSPETSISSMSGPAQILDKINVNSKQLWKFKVKDS